MKQPEKSNLKRTAIVQATLKLVNSNGFHATPMSQLAKMANVSPGTIYLYFDNKQDLANKIYLEVKERFTTFAFKNYNPKLSIEANFKEIWYRIADYKLREIEEAIFLGQCDNTPMIDEQVRLDGIAYLTPFIELLNTGKAEGVLKNMSDYLLYAYTISPISFLLVMQTRDSYLIDEKSLDDAYHAAWDSIRNS